MSLPAVKQAIQLGGEQKPPTLQIESLLRHLVAYAVDDMIEPAKVLQRNDVFVDEIVLEATIDGTDYCLVRRQQLLPTQGSLSPRELTIARLIAQGLPNKSIGDVLDISPWTVATHLRRIFVKFNVTSRAAMVARLVKEKLL